MTFYYYNLIVIFGVYTDVKPYFNHGDNNVLQDYLLYYSYGISIYYQIRVIFISFVKPEEEVVEQHYLWVL